MATTLRATVEEWKRTGGDDTNIFVLVDCNERERQLIFQIDRHLVKAHCPVDALFNVDTDDSALDEWASDMGSFAAERVGRVTVAQFLDKAVSLYRGTPLPSRSGATAAGAGGAAEEKKRKRDEDEFGDMDEDDDKEEEDGWGDGEDDFEKEGGVAEISTTESEWAKWHNLKKRWEKKEAELRRVAARVDEAKSKSQIFSSAAATKIITNTLIELMKNGSKSGFDAAPVDDNIFHWRVRISGFDGCPLATDLLKLQAKYRYSYVELEFKFLMDLYPFYPPSVRLVRPRLKNFLMGRIVCCEELQLAKWNPVRDIKDILGSIKRILTTYGAVEGDEVNDPANDLPPYTALEFQLLRLSMLTEITPRIVKTMSDSEQKTLVVPKVKIITSETYEKPGSGDSGSLRRGGTAGWAKGTGYGSGTQSDWDVDAFLAAQKKKDSEILEICTEMLHELQAE